MNAPPSASSQPEPPSEASAPANVSQPTLPPPDWAQREGPYSAASLALAAHRRDAPIARRHGARAELASLHARLSHASDSADAEAERAAASTLARALVARGTELDVATRLARRALLLGDDPGLREELAGWLSEIGEPAIAAATLRAAVEDSEDAANAPTWLEIGLLLARAGDVAGAVEALERAALLDPTSAIASERIGMIGGWAPTVVDADRAARAYLDAFERRDEAGERAAALENLLRAFAAQPGDPIVADRLSAVLLSRGRIGAADEVKREHALATVDRQNHVHLRRMHDAIAEGDWVRALGAGLDARLDGELDPLTALEVIEGGPEAASGGASFGFDEVLLRVGLNELLALRLELGSDLFDGAEAARFKVALARLYGTVLASPERALEAWIDAFVLDPAHPVALAALERHAETARDVAPLIEAYVRALERSVIVGDDRHASSARQLCRLADERLAEPALAVWALGRARDLGPLEPELSELEQSLRARTSEQEQDLHAARAELELASGDARLETLRRLAALLRARPDQFDEYVEVVRQLRESCPDERAWDVTLERLLVRRGAWNELEQLFEERLSRALLGVERWKARYALALLRWRLGNGSGALDVVDAAFQEQEGVHASTAALMACFAAGLGDQARRAQALERIAAPLPAPLRALLGSVAAEVLLENGARDAAFALADAACRIEPSLSRAAAVRARAALSQSGTAETEALERAMASVLPRADFCQRLAELHEIEEPVLALVWTQRWLALRPGDRVAVTALLTRAARHGDAARISDALAWVFTQPLPLKEFVREIAGALRQLATLDADRAAALARRALDTLGPRHELLRAAVLDVAELAEQRGLGITLLERHIASGADLDGRATLLLELAHKRRLAGDNEGALRSLLRALHAGAAPERISAELSAIPEAKTSDGLICELELRAVLAARADGEVAAQLWRELGALRWDLAADHEGALKAWIEASHYDQERGLERLARDLIAFAGFDQARERLLEISAKQPEAAKSARVLVAAAAAAMDVGQSGSAFELARAALELDVSRADALAIVERAASDADLLAEVYAKIAAAALGCYGERAVHYRAARQFERRGELTRALEHAILAFDAVPAEGVAFVMMVRLAQRTETTDAVVRAIEAVAARIADPAQRSFWLRRAALFTDGTSEGKRQRFDVLLRAVALGPDLDAIQTLGEALTDLAAFAPEDADILELRLETALTTLLPRLEGSEGAKCAIVMASNLVRSFGWVRLALLAAWRAVECDERTGEFGKLHEYTPALANEPSASREFVARCLEYCEQADRNVGRALIELAAGLAAEFDDATTRARLLVRAAEREPENKDLIRSAERAALAAGDEALRNRLLEVIPLSDRVSNLLDFASSAEQAGDLPAAIDALDKLLQTAGAAPDARQRALFRLRQLLTKTGRVEELERVLERELVIAGETSVGVQIARELANLRLSRGATSEAMTLLERALGWTPGDEAVLADLLNAARAIGDVRRAEQVLAQLVDATSDVVLRVQHLRELAPLLEQNGERAAALARYEQLLELEPSDTDALLALERDAEARGEYERLLDVLERRANVAPSADDLRRIRLRRAAILEQRLGRPEAARQELERLLSASGDHLSALRVLADLNERLGAELRAAPLWLRASGLSRDRAEAADLARRACQAYLGGGDVDSARRVMEGIEPWAQSEALLELVVEIERRTNNPLGLAQALEELARVSSEAPLRRAELLLEAARAALSAGETRSALSQAQRAAKLVPRYGDAQIMSKWLEYRTRGPGSSEGAHATLAELRAADAPVDASLVELRAFLVAEALALGDGPDAAYQDLIRAEQTLGPRPLIALLLGEHLVRRGDAGGALAYFDQALSGDLRHVRARGRVALVAARAAKTSGQLERATAFVEIALGDTETREEALALSSELQAGPPPEPPPTEVSSVEVPSEPPAARDQRRVITGIATPFSDELEGMLLDELAKGSVEAGHTLIERLETQPERSHDFVAVARRMAVLLPGDAWVLGKLHQAALSDKNFIYARALEHVTHCFDMPRLAAPPLGDQPEDPERVRALLFRDSIGVVGEALNLVWDGAEHVFRRDPTTYGVTGLERVPLSAPTPLGTSYAATARILGLTRTPLFQRRSTASITVSVALLSPPAVIVSGDIRQDSAELRYHLAAMLAAAMPERALLFGTSESQAKTILDALVLAFGPPRANKSSVGSALHLAEVLWESIPARAQRRLRELCDNPKIGDYRDAIEQARRAVRRAGFFVCGDLGVAIRETCLDEKIEGEFAGPNALATLCGASPAIADLIRLATSPEYAAARWQPPRPGQRYGSGTWKLS